MAIVTVTSKGIVRNGVDPDHANQIAGRLVNEQGFHRTTWVDYLVKKVDDGHVYLTIKKNNLRVEVHYNGKIQHFAATTPDRLKIRLDQIFQGEQP